MWFYFILILVQLILYPVIIYRAFKAKLKKNKSSFKKHLIRLIILLIFSGLFFEKIPGSNYFWMPIDAIHQGFSNKSLTGKWFVSGKKIYEWAPERHFNGDGYSIRISEMDDDLVAYFQKPDSLFYTNYPKQSRRENWQTKPWRSTPMEEDDLDAYYFAFHTTDTLGFQLIDLLEEDGNYYSYQYYLHGDDASKHYGNIDFYLICPKRKLIIKINHNT